MTTIEQRLQQQIESAVREYMVASRAAVTASLDRAFAATPARIPTAERATPVTRVRVATKPAKRRTAVEIAALSEHLYEMISAHPGEGMVALSKRMRVSGPQLQRVVALLRNTERIQTAGARQQMRYFPRA
jgi:hypothetical protein